MIRLLIDNRGIVVRLGQVQEIFVAFNALNAESNPICHLLALLGAHHILHIRRIRVNPRASLGSNPICHLLATLGAHHILHISRIRVNPRASLGSNPICHLLAMLGAHHILHISRIRVNPRASLGSPLNRMVMCKS